MEMIISTTAQRMECIRDNVIAVATNRIRTSIGTQERSRSRIIPQHVTELQITNPRAVYIIDYNMQEHEHEHSTARIRAVLDAHSDTVRCICPLPCGDLLTAGGKMDATVRVWDAAVVADALKEEVEENDSSSIMKTGTENENETESGNAAQPTSEQLEENDVTLSPGLTSASILLTEAKTLKEPGYVFDLKVLPNHSKNKADDSEDLLYAVAAARYNVVKIII